MINYHPTTELLSQFVAGALPASVSVIVASHVEMCKVCADSTAALTEQAAQNAFINDRGLLDHSALMTDSEAQGQQDSAIIEAITRLEPDSLTTAPKTTAEGHTPAADKVKSIEVAGQQIALPRAIRTISLKPWLRVGKVSRSRLNLEDNNLKCSLMHICRGGNVPSHTHRGFEITLMLEGAYEDEMGEYHRGDFIWLDGKHTHQPTSKSGCICLTVSSDAMHFTHGVSRLLNPVTRFIY